ncbi:hypothetical protein A3B57_03780 [Microgenomates group bacterium RIFCSPLOWO2_01_FULL_47_10]|nr:MAG: hypothetical protein A3B57_03780 [Microgenomates group bacterium RIFCSPLOWO2_01_FULL_47_10]
MKLSICLLTKNSQDALSRLLPTLTFADEIVIIDDLSNDNTAHIASAHQARFFKRKLDDDFSAQRNFALSKAKCPWVLFLDPDEQVSPELAAEITATITSPKYDGYQLKRQDIFLNKELRYGETGHLWLTRLGKKSAGVWQRPVHEIWAIDRFGRLKQPLSHASHQTVASFITKINYYTEIESHYRLGRRQTVSLWQTLVYPLGKFIHNYIVRRGFLDGFEGFIMAVMMSIHSFLVRAKMMKVKVHA